MDTELDAPKTASTKVVHKAAEAKGEFIENKIPEKNCKTRTCNWLNSNKCWGNYCFIRKKRRNIEWIKKISMIKLEHYEISKGPFKNNITSVGRRAYQN